jgi:UDP-glucuronate 4-epimerase
VEAILNDRPVDLFNHGQMHRDFTYIDDIVEGVIRVADRIPQPDDSWNTESPNPGTSSAPFRVYNIGNNEPIGLTHLIELIEKCVGKTARKNLLPMQPGDVLETYADIDDLIRDVGFKPSTSIETGIARFVEWYRDYRGGPRDVP